MVTFCCVPAHIVTIGAPEYVPVWSFPSFKDYFTCYTGANITVNLVTLVPHIIIQCIRLSIEGLCFYFDIHVVYSRIHLLINRLSVEETNKYVQ